MSEHSSAPDGRHHRLHLWPQGLAGRIAVLVVLGLVAVMAVAGAIYLHERWRDPLELFDEAMAGRVVAAVELLEATPPAQRRTTARALSEPGLHVRIRPPDDDRRLRGGSDWQEHGAAADTVRQGLAALMPRPISVHVWDGEDDEPEGGLGRRWHARMPRLGIAVGLNDGARVFFFIAQPPPMRLGPLFWLVLTMLLVVLASIWAAHHMARPLRRIAGAADRLGLDGTAEPLPEHGPRELRNATRAFNRMQARIRRLVDDRTLMLAAVSHDLRTVLTRLRLRAEFIEDAEQQAKAIADLDEMQAMLDATLTFARDDAADEHVVRLDLAALLRSLVDDLADAGRQAAYDGPDHCAFTGRLVALRRAFANLIENALRYGERADVALETDGAGITVTVADRGPGVPPELRERVFDPFFRVEGSRNRDTGGAGLGLAVVRAIINRHGGTIALDDRPGGGLIVRVTLPSRG